MGYDAIVDDADERLGAFVSAANGREESHLVVIAQSVGGMSKLLIHRDGERRKIRLDPGNLCFVVGEQVTNGSTVRKREGIGIAADEVFEHAEEEDTDLHRVYFDCIAGGVFGR